MKRWLVSCLAGLALAPAACALAEHRALIVGVGDHQDAAMNLGCATDFGGARSGWPSDRLGLGPVDVIRAPLPKICRTPMNLPGIDLDTAMMATAAERLVSR